MIETFLKYLSLEKRYSQHTLTSYRNDLNQFQEFVTEDPIGGSVEDADHNLIRAWIVSLVDQDISPRSVNRKIATLRSFYKFLVRRGDRETDPMYKIQALKIKKQLPVFVRENEMMRLLDQFSFPDTFVGWRDRLILELLYGTGMRLSELIHLEEEGVNLEEGTLKVTGKRNKQRLIPFSKSIGLIIERYKKSKLTLPKNNSNDLLLVTKEGGQCYPMLIYRTVHKYLTQFTSADKRGPHVLRHTFATHLLDKGADLNAIKDLLGHSSLAATQVYTHNSLDKIKKVFDQAHPKA